MKNVSICSSTVIFLFFLFLPLNAGWAYYMPDYCPMNEGSAYTYVDEWGHMKNIEIITVSDFLQMPVASQFSSVSSMVGHVGFYDNDHQYFDIYGWNDQGFRRLYQCEWDDDEIEELAFSQPPVMLPLELEEGQSYSSTFDGFETQDGSRYRRRSGDVNVMFLGVENVSVNAGNFQDCLKIRRVVNERYDYVSGRVKEKQETCTQWYAYGIGLVKEECDETETEDGETEIEHDSLSLYSYSGITGQDNDGHAAQAIATATVSTELDIIISSIEFNGSFFSCTLNYIDNYRWELDTSSISESAYTQGTARLDASDLSIILDPVSIMDTNYYVRLKLIDMEHLIWEVEDVHIE